VLSPHEVLWEKQLPEITERLISESKDNMDYEDLVKVVPKRRDKTKAVTFKAAKGTAV
jgi:hypothetical protein